jgi:hypothetical protein
MAPQCWRRVVGVVLVGNHEQLPVLILSKDFNEYFMQVELCTYERKRKAGFPGVQLYEGESFYPRLVDRPIRKKYFETLLLTASASNR